MNQEMKPKERFFACLSNEAIDRPAVINPTSVATTESCNLIGVNFAGMCSAFESKK